MSGTAPIKNVFDWRGPSQTIDSFGRMKSERQIALDGNRVNQESNIGKNDRTQTDRTNEITGRRMTARWQ